MLRITALHLRYVRWKPIEPVFANLSPENVIEFQEIKDDVKEEPVEALREKLTESSFTVRTEARGVERAVTGLAPSFVELGDLSVTPPLVHDGTRPDESMGTSR
jgi:hypothetical protein